MVTERCPTITKPFLFIQKAQNSLRRECTCGIQRVANLNFELGGAVLTFSPIKFCACCCKNTPCFSKKCFPMVIVLLPMRNSGQRSAAEWGNPFQNIHNHFRQSSRYKTGFLCSCQPLCNGSLVLKTIIRCSALPYQLAQVAISQATEIEILIQIVF